MFTTRKGLLAVIIVLLVSTGGFASWKWLPSFGAGPNITKEAQTHILYGDKKGGGHKFGESKNCKSEFPKGWDDAKIISNIRKVAANDNLKWKKQGNGYYTATDKVDGVRVKVVLDKEKDDVVTAYPVSGKANSCKTSAKTVSVQKKKSASVAEASAPKIVEPATGSVANASSRQARIMNFNNR